jgi:predicted Zn-dependent peptidase
MSETFAGFRRHDLGGLPVLWAEDPRFKTARVVFQSRRPLDSRAAARSLLPGLLVHGTERDPDRPAVARRMEALYGARVLPSTGKVGEVHQLRLLLDTVAGRFLPGHPDQLGEGLAFLADIAVRPRLEGEGFPAEVFERERRNAADAVRAEIDDRGSHAFQQALRHACAGEPMAIPAHGGLESVLALGPGDPETARRDFLGRGDALVCACGAFDEAELLSAVERFAADLPARRAEAIPGAVAVEPRPVRRVVERVDLQQSKLVMVLRFPPSDDPELWLGRRLLVAMFGGGPSSRLFREVRERRSLAYYAAATADRHKGLLTVQVGLDLAAVEAAEAEIRTQLEALCTGDFGDEELAIARAQLVHAVRSVDDSAASRTQFALDQWGLGTDRTPAGLLAAYESAGRELVLRAGAGIWEDLVYLLAPRETDGGPR